MTAGPPVLMRPHRDGTSPLKLMKPSCAMALEGFQLGESKP